MTKPANPSNHALKLAATLQERLRGGLPGHLAIEFVEQKPGALTLQLAIQPMHMAANGFLHAGTVVSLADTACGFGCIANLPAAAHNFTTLELKSNFLRTATSGHIYAVAIMAHGGQRTQVWDATVYDDAERTLALFRCTQLILYP